MADSFKAKILIVDDLPEKFLVYKSILEELGQEIIAVKSGTEALKQVLKHDFAVVLLDVNMPGMDGFAMVKALRADPRTQDIAIAMLTSEGSLESEANAFAAGADDYILKPVEPRRLAARVKALVARSRGRQLSVSA